MQVDTGAEVSVILEYTYKLHFPHLAPSKSSVVLKTYSDQIMPVVGELQLQVRYGVQSAHLTLVVVGGNGLTLLEWDIGCSL